MVKIMSRGDKAAELFKNGYNCAQSVLGVFCEESGLDANTAFKLANGFGGGARCGELCGAITGSLMAIGLKCGFYVENDFKQKSYCNKKAYEFIEKFKEEHGSALCRELLGADIRNPDNFNMPAAKESHVTICPRLVRSAVGILENMDI